MVVRTNAFYREFHQLAGASCVPKRNHRMTPFLFLWDAEPQVIFVHVKCYGKSTTAETISVWDFPNSTWECSVSPAWLHSRMASCLVDILWICDCTFCLFSARYWFSMDGLKAGRRYMISFFSVYLPKGVNVVITNDSARNRWVIKLQFWIFIELIFLRNRYNCDSGNVKRQECLHNLQYFSAWQSQSNLVLLLMNKLTKGAQHDQDLRSTIIPIHSFFSLPHHALEFFHWWSKL